MLEYFVHIDPDHPPNDLVLAEADVPDNLPNISISLKELPANWRQVPAPAALAGFGDAFVRSERAAVLTVPSALAPAESNWSSTRDTQALRKSACIPPMLFRTIGGFSNRIAAEHARAAQ
jgi:hypothetical protein